MDALTAISIWNTGYTMQNITLFINSTMGFFTKDCMSRRKVFSVLFEISLPIRGGRNT